MAKQPSRIISVSFTIHPDVAARMEKARQQLEVENLSEVFREEFKILEWYLKLRAEGRVLAVGHVHKSGKFSGEIIELDLL